MLLLENIVGFVIRATEINKYKILLRKKMIDVFMMKEFWLVFGMLIAIIVIILFGLFGDKHD